MRTYAAIGAALLAFGARAQSEQTPPAAPPAATAPAPEKPPKGTFVLSEKSTITISGRAWAAFEGVQARGSTASPDTNNVKHRFRVTNDSSYLRLRGYPFTADVFEFIDRCDRVYVVEQNRDSQMLSLLRMEATPAQIAKLRTIPCYAGLPLDGRTVTTELMKQEQG